MAGIELARARGFRPEPILDSTSGGLMSKSSMVVAFTLFLSPSVAAQTTIYSTFGPGDSYAQNTGYALLGVQWIAAPFTYTGTSGDFLFDFRVGIAADGNITASFWVGNDMN